jgi:hypothetical protein
MTQRFVAMLGCGSCHIRGCHESCSLRFASSDPHSLLFASSDPQAVIVRHRPKRSRATTANADRLIAGCLITSAAPLRLLLSISKYLPYLTRPRGCARCLCCNRWTIRPPWVTFDRWTSGVVRAREIDCWGRSAKAAGGILARFPVEPRAARIG